MIDENYFDELRRKAMERIRKEELADYMRELKKIAIHEAGHAVMHHHYGDEIECVTIKPDSEFAGSVTPKKKDRDLSKHSENAAKISAEALIKEIEKTAHIDLAGLVAENIQSRSQKIMKMGGGSADMESLKMLIEMLGLEILIKDFIRTFYNGAEEILKSKWKSVIALSQALLKNETVSGGEESRIIENNF